MIPSSDSDTSLPLEKRVRLMAELAAPYRRLRRFIYLAAGGSAGIGAFVFFFRTLAGRELNTSLPNLALQLGVLAGILGLVALDNRAQTRLEDRIRQRLQSEKTVDS